MSADDPFKNNRILVIDDNPAIHEDIKKILHGRGNQNTTIVNAKALLFGEETVAHHGGDFEIDSAYQGEEGLRLVRAAHESGCPYSVAFVDVRMPPGWDGVETITRIWQEFPDLQVVICTAYSDYSFEQMIRQIGKTDSMLILKKPFDNIEVLQFAHALTEKWQLNYQLKNQMSNLDLLVAQRTSELQTANDQLKGEIAERLVVEKALRLSEERFSKAFKSSPIPLAIQSLRSEKFVDTNQGFQLLTGFSREQLIGHTPDALKLWGEPTEGKAILKTLYAEMSVRNKPCQMRSQSGNLREVLLSVELFELDGEPFILTIAQDITEQIQLENQLRQSQKMEAVGQLAAGVAHDFNNILTVIQGNAGLLLNTKLPNSPERKPLQTICSAAERATKLVRQLLTFSRKQYIQISPMNLRTTLTSVAEMLPRVLGELVAVEFICPATLPVVNADASMMEQLIMNLAVNARDAMPKGGRLIIRADAVDVAPERVRQNRDAQAGAYICLSVVDTGCGIPPEIQARIFEPFFTTKPVGKGTGLGLATVYGIAKQHRGWVEVESEVDKGATFRVFLPVSKDETTAAAVAPVLPQEVQGGCETILVAEDEEEVRDFVVEVLKSNGYKVFAAASGAQALAEWSGRVHELDLLLTDMVMPGGVMGRELAERLVEKNNRLKAIYTSGYSPGMAGKDLQVFMDKNFLAKPFGPGRLLQKVRRCLDEAPQSG